MVTIGNGNEITHNDLYTSMHLQSSQGLTPSSPHSRQFTRNESNVRAKNLQKSFLPLLRRARLHQAASFFSILTIQLLGLFWRRSDFGVVPYSRIVVSRLSQFHSEKISWYTSRNMQQIIKVNIACHDIPPVSELESNEWRFSRRKLREHNCHPSWQSLPQVTFPEWGISPFTWFVFQTW